MRRREGLNQSRGIIDRSTREQLVEQQRLHKERERVSKQYGDPYHDKPWNVYESGIYDYEMEFAPVLEDLGDRPLLNFVQERRAQGKPIVALDVFGEGQALRGLLVDRGLAVTLQDLRDKYARDFDRSIIKQINGDIYNQRTWEKMQTWLQTNGDESGAFNLIMERGVGALENFPNDPKLMDVLLGRLWKMLSTDNGLLVMQLPNVVKPYVQPWMDRLERDYPNLHLAQYADTVRFPDEIVLPKIYPVLRLNRTPESPDTLPAIAP